MTFSLLFLTSIVFVNTTNVKAYDTPSIEVWGTQLLSNTCVKDRFPGITRTMNGTLVVVYDCSMGTPPNEDRTYNIIRSFDNGITWTEPIELFSFVGSSWDGHWVLKTAPNGDVLFAPVYKGGAEGGGNWSTRFIRSQDNGSTWHDWYWMDESLDNDGDNQYLLYDLLLYNKVLYGFTMDLYWNYDAYIVYSDDNGSSWSKLGNDIVSTNSDEFYALPLGNGIWRTIHRDSEGWSNNLISYDNGTTWVTTNEDLPMTQNRGPSLMWLDDEVILSITEGDLITDAAHIHESHNNMSTWSLVTNLGSGAGQNYGRGVSLPKRSGNLGGWAYVVYGSGLSLYGCWVANNATQTWIWPPGPDDSGSDFYTSRTSSGNNPAFVDINEQSNNSDLTTNIRWGNCTRFFSDDYIGSDSFMSVDSYQIRISNASDFSTVFVNETGINSLYAGDYSENDTHFYFRLNDTIEGYGGTFGTHYYQVRARVKVRTT